MKRGGGGVLHMKSDKAASVDGNAVEVLKVVTKLLIAYLRFSLHVWIMMKHQKIGEMLV